MSFGYRSKEDCESRSKGDLIFQAKGLYILAEYSFGADHGTVDQNRRGYERKADPDFIPQPATGYEPFGVMPGNEWSEIPSLDSSVPPIPWSRETLPAGGTPDIMDQYYR